MAKRRGNPNWGKPEPIGPVVPTVTSFEQIVKDLALPPDFSLETMSQFIDWSRAEPFEVIRGEGECAV